MKCLYCDTETKNKKFCSSSCAATFNNKKRKYKKKERPKLFCVVCEKELNFQQFLYCSNKCRGIHEKNTTIQNWLDGKTSGGYPHYGSLNPTIRKYILELFDNKCQKCGWSEVNQFSKTTPLEIDHIDGNSQNNKIENLTVLCPNCHSLTEFHGILNRGNGRRFYREAYIKSNK